MRYALIDALRVASAASVALYHFLYKGALGQKMPQVVFNDAAISLAQFGFIGVPIFFFISGFVVSQNSTQKSALSYARARLLSIYPTYIFCAILTLLVYATLSSPLYTPDVRGLLLHLIFLPELFGSPYIDGVYWSMLYEVVFYTQFGLLLALVPRHHCTKIFVAYPFAVAALLAADVSAPAIGGFFLYFYLGAHISQAADRQSAVTWCASGLYIFLCAYSSYEATAGFIPNCSDAQRAIHAALITFGLTVLVIKLPKIQGRSSDRLALLGKATYPFYLLHAGITYAVLSALSPTQYGLLFLFVTTIILAAISLVITSKLTLLTERLTKRHAA